MSVRMNKLSEFKEVKSALRKPPHYNTKEYSNSKQQIARFTECVFQASSSGMLKTKAEATIMLRHAIEIRQVLQSIQVGGAHTQMLSNSPGRTVPQSWPVAMKRNRCV